jgi:hypothetical protein
VRIVVCTGETRRSGIVKRRPGTRQIKEITMPTVTNPNLTLTESEGRVTIRVRADVTYSPFERQLAGLGQDWHPHITVHDFDGGDGVGAELFEFLNGTDRLDDFAVTVGSGVQVLPLDEERTVDREVLKGDPANNDDEIKAKIRIHSNDTQVVFTSDVLTDQEILPD